MEEFPVGWIVGVAIGALAGLLGEKFMQSNTGPLMSVSLGVIGALLANAVLEYFGATFAGWAGYLIAGFMGACAMIGAWQLLRRWR